MKKILPVIDTRLVEKYKKVLIGSSTTNEYYTQGFPELFIHNNPMLQYEISKVSGDGSVLFFSDMNFCLTNLAIDNNTKDITVCFIVDKNSFEAFNTYIEQVYDCSNIEIVYLIKDVIASYSSKGKLHLEETFTFINCLGEKIVMSKKFNLVIANTPFTIGNTITTFIKDNVDYDRFVNLLPLDKYGTGLGGLFSYIIPETFTHTKDYEGFGDCHTIPKIACIDKKQHITDYKEFERQCLFSKKHNFNKYWEKQFITKPSYEKHMSVSDIEENDLFNYSVSNTFVCGFFTAHDKVHEIMNLKAKFDGHPEAVEKEINAAVKSRDCSGEYLWNILGIDDSINKVCSKSCFLIKFKTLEEKKNFVQWWYSAELSGKPAKSGLASIILSMMNKPTSCSFEWCIPHVDWTRSWTDEEILREYGFTDVEIADILALGELNLYGSASINI